MPRYNASHFDPPAPLAQVTLRNVSTGATVIPPRAPDIFLSEDDKIVRSTVITIETRNGGTAEPTQGQALAQRLCDLL